MVERNKIYAMDCLEGMKRYLKDKEVDVVVTSPPYNIGIKYNLTLISSLHRRRTNDGYQA